MARKDEDYDSDSIQTQRFPDNIRASPAMYIGGTDAHGMFVVLRELLDNAVDEYLAGRNTFVAVKADADGSYWVQDGGAGIPQGIKKFNVVVHGKAVASSMPTMQAVFGELHTSGKFKSDAYKVSIGSHGVGSKGTNATAEYFNVSTCFKGVWYGLGFKKGHLVHAVTKIQAPKSPFTGKTLTKGTLIHYKPDATIFKVKTFPPTMLQEWSELQAYLNPGFRIIADIRGKKKQYLKEGGPKDYIKDQLELLKAESEADIFWFKNELATVAVAFTNVDGFQVRGFTNGLGNSQGGTHVEAVAGALFSALSEHKGAKQVFKEADFKDGLLGIVNANLHKAAFSSQDKAKLTDERMGKEFEALLLVEAKKFFAKNKALAKRLCDRAAKVSELKSKFKASKAVATALNTVKRQGLPPNYAPAHRSVPVEKRVLFIVEGDSAAGGMRQVREKNHALLPLTGKIMNCKKSKGDKALLSKAILNILGAIGYDPKQADPMKKLQVGRVVFLADPDPDGLHINCLLHTLFQTYLPEMYERGMIFVADMPEFYAVTKDRLFVGPTLSSVQKKLDKAKAKADIHHAKGWGEIDHQIMKVLVVDDTAKVIRIKPLSDEDIAAFSQIMGRIGDDPAETTEKE